MLHSIKILCIGRGMRQYCHQRQSAFGVLLANKTAEKNLYEISICEQFFKKIFWKINCNKNCFKHWTLLHVWYITSKYYSYQVFMKWSSLNQLNSTQFSKLFNKLWICKTGGPHCGTGVDLMVVLNNFQCTCKLTRFILTKLS